MVLKTKFISDGPDSTVEAGVSIAERLDFPAVVYLEGELGAGKTLLCQAIIKAKGYQGAVTSPTYNLIQEYPVVQGIVYHMDLYRLDNPSEIEFLGIEDLINRYSLFLIEWPTKGNGYIPAPNHEIKISKEQGGQNFMRKIELLSR